MPTYVDIPAVAACDICGQEIHVAHRVEAASGARTVQVGRVFGEAAEAAERAAVEAGWIVELGACVCPECFAVAAEGGLVVRRKGAFLGSLDAAFLPGMVAKKARKMMEEGK